MHTEGEPNLRNSIWLESKQGAQKYSQESGTKIMKKSSHVRLD